MTGRLGDTLKTFVDEEARAASVPSEATRVEQLRRLIARRRTVRAAVAAAIAVVVVGGGAGAAVSLVGAGTALPPAASVTGTHDASSAHATPAETTSGPDEDPSSSPTAQPSPSDAPTETAGVPPTSAAGQNQAPTSSIPASAGPPPFTAREQNWAFVSLVDGLRVRETPGTSGTLLATLPAGTRFRMFDSSTQTYEDGLWWYQVINLSVVLPGTDRGWVAAKGADGTPWIDLVPSGCTAAAYQDGPASVTTFEGLKAGIVGTWTGCVSTRWADDYNVTLTFRADGSYSGHALTAPPTHEPLAALYWGSDQDLPSKTYVMHDLQDDGTGRGEITIAAYTGETTRADIKNLRLMGNSLTFEVFSGSRGPVTYRLTREG